MMKIALKFGKKINTSRDTDIVFSKNSSSESFLWVIRGVLLLIAAVFLVKLQVNVVGFSIFASVFIVLSFVVGKSTYNVYTNRFIYVKKYFYDYFSLIKTIKFEELDRVEYHPMLTSWMATTVTGNPVARKSSFEFVLKNGEVRKIPPIETEKQMKNIVKEINQLIKNNERQQPSKG